jgi:hypothetical protein
LVRAGEPDLLAELPSRLATSEPIDLLAEASVFSAALDPRSLSPFDRTASRDEGSASLDELVRTFPEVDRSRPPLCSTALPSLLLTICSGHGLFDAAIGQPRRQLRYKCSWYGSTSIGRPLLSLLQDVPYL